MSGYDSFIASKVRTKSFDSCPRRAALSSRLFPHQSTIADWALTRGRAAVFADTGLGKTSVECEFAHHVSSVGRVLILAPLAVAEQTVREAAKQLIPVVYARRPSDTDCPIVITNYDLLEHFIGEQWAGVVLDESSILKAYDGKTRNAIINGFRDVPFRLACTATPAPNDFTELGNHSEFLGIKSRVEMLAEYFVHDGGETQTWRLKGHAEESFWRWVCSWAVAVKRPSDLGFDDAGYALPPLEMHEHIIDVDHEDAKSQGLLFAPDVRTLADQRATRRMTMKKRVALAMELVCPGSLNTRPTDAEKQPPTQITERAETLREAQTETPSSATSTTTTAPTKTRRARRGANVNLASTSAVDDGTQKTQSTEQISSSVQLNGLAPIQTSTSTSVSSVTTELGSRSIDDCSNSKAEVAQSAAAESVSTPTRALANGASSMSITATQPAVSEACSARTATELSVCSETTPSGWSEPWIIWVELNDEQQALEKLLGDECASIYGSLDPDEKSRRMMQFINGEKRVLLTKPTVCGWGLNLQHCARVIFVGASHSYEQTYQAIRRCWRFGQTKPVDAHIIRAETEGAIVANYRRKEADAERLSQQMVGLMRDALGEHLGAAKRETNAYAPNVHMRIPDWLTEAA